MRKVKNQKAVRRMAYKSMKANRTRNLIALLSIMLTAMLFTSVFTIGSGAVESFQRQTMRQSGSDWHGSIKDITPQLYEQLSSHPLIKESSNAMLMAEEIRNHEFLKRHVEIWYYPKQHYDHHFIEIINGRVPKAADEILLDEVSLELLGMAPQAGQEVTLELLIKQNDQETIKRTFRVSGVTKSDPVMNVGFAIVSDSYLQAYESDLNYTYPEDYSRVGAVRMDVNFSNSMQIQDKLNQVITENGYSVSEDSPDFIASNANWAYISDGLGSDPVTTGLLIGALLLIMLTGYLIIYNVFHISVIRDIRYYGLLKTIGTTGRQVKKILKIQALLLAAAGIPMGLIVGFLAGKAILPAIMARTVFTGEQPVVSLNPLIFIGAAVFTLVTVFISVMRPAQIAARTSPVEAVRYTEESNKKSKKTTDGGKVRRMAFSNLERNKGRTVLVVISLSLSIILLNSVFTLTNSFDMNKFLSKFATTDFLIANAVYFGQDHYWGLSNETIAEENLTESFVQACEELDGFQQGSRIYLSQMAGISKNSWEVPEYIPKNQAGEYGFLWSGELVPFSEWDDDSYRITLYGVDDYLIEKMEVWKGEKDPEVIREKLHSGKYVLGVVDVDDNGFAIEETLKHQPGDKIVLTYGENEQCEMEILTIIKNNYSGMTNRMSGDFAYYTTSDVFKEMMPEQFLMSYGFDVRDDQEESINAFLEDYTQNQEPLMHYESRKMMQDEYAGLKNLFLLVGGALSAVIGLIGILNFINCILTSIVTRRKEFAMMEAIGMTGKQLTGMLITEGLYYVLMTIIFSLLFGSLLSLTGVRALSGGIWFLNYRFVAAPMLVIFPFLVVLGILIPVLALRVHQKDSVVERLHISE